MIQSEIIKLLFPRLYNRLKRKNKSYTWNYLEEVCVSYGIEFTKKYVDGYYICSVGDVSFPSKYENLAYERCILHALNIISDDICNKNEWSKRATIAKRVRIGS